MKRVSILQVIIGLIIIVVIVGVYWGVQSGQFKLTKLPGSVATKDYQAIFLTNGQVYFGKANKINSSYVELRDIYYLQVQQPIQPKPEEKKEQKAEDEQPKITLIKLGNEIHGPIDAMNINREQILFWEDLKDTGQVVQAIKKDKETKKDEQK